MNEVFKETEIMVEEVNTYIFSGQLKYSYFEHTVLYMYYLYVAVWKKRFVISYVSNEVMLRVGYYKEVHC